MRSATSWGASNPAPAKSVGARSVVATLISVPRSESLSETAAKTLGTALTAVTQRRLSRFAFPERA